MASALPSESLEQHVRQFLPDCDGKELEHRVALLKTRDRAAALRGRSDCPLAINYACDAHSLAGDFVFLKRATLPELELAVQTSHRMIGAALGLDSLSAQGADE